MSARIARLVPLCLLLAMFAPAAAARPGEPIIDMHIHAWRLDLPPGTPACPGDQNVVLPAMDPAKGFDPSLLGKCERPLLAAASDDALRDETIAALRSLHVVRAVADGSVADIAAWREAAPGIPSGRRLRHEARAHRRGTQGAARRRPAAGVRGGQHPVPRHPCRRPALRTVFRAGRGTGYPDRHPPGRGSARRGRFSRLRGLSRQPDHAVPARGRAASASEAAHLRHALRLAAGRRDDRDRHAPSMGGWASVEMVPRYAHRAAERPGGAACWIDDKFLSQTKNPQHVRAV